MNDNAFCPYCNSVLAKPPSRKTRCPSCQNDIYVLSGRLFTKKAKDEQSIIKKYWSPFRPLSLNREESASWQMDFMAYFDLTRRQLNDQFGFEASVNDTLWRMLNEAVAKESDPAALGRYYAGMASIVADEGKDPSQYLTLAGEFNARRLLVEVRSFGDWVPKVRLQTANDQYVCSNCASWAEKALTVDEALRVLSEHRCESLRGCRCGISAAFD